MAGDGPHLRLRLEHLGRSHLKLTWGQGALRFDPDSPPPGAEPLLLTWNELERSRGVLEAARQGLKPRVVSSERLLGWVQGQGAVDGVVPPTEVDGARVDALAYRPVPWVDAKEALLKLGSALRGPARAAARLGQRWRLPSAWPLAFRVDLPEAGVFVHLNCALHRWTEDDWLREAYRKFGGARWLLAGVDHDQQAAFEERIEPFAPRHLILADLVGDVRRSLDLPVAPLTPLADRLRARGMQVLVLASDTSLRFED